MHDYTNLAARQDLKLSTVEWMVAMMGEARAKGGEEGAPGHHGR